MSNYAAIVSRETLEYSLHPLGARTYWATSSADGRYCYVSVAGDDSVSVLSYESEQEVARIPVGYHPQRARTGRLADDLFR
jgi:YVTN family beta-propeller protein